MELPSSPHIWMIDRYQHTNFTGIETIPSIFPSQVPDI
jgi:hypothetical protein